MSMSELSQKKNMHQALEDIPPAYIYNYSKSVRSRWIIVIIAGGVIRGTEYVAFDLRAPEVNWLRFNEF